MTTKDIAKQSDEGYEALRLDNQLCFALYAASRALTRAYRDRLAPIGLTYPQFLVLMVLWEGDGLTITRIGRRLRLDSGTLTPLLRRLEAAELVTRSRGARDEREVRIWLTERGAAMQDAALDARRYAACRLGMSEGQIEALKRELMVVVAQLEESAGAPEAESPAED